MEQLAATIPHAARLAALPEHHVRNAVKNGTLPARQVGVRRIILMDDFKAWLASQRTVNKQKEAPNA